MFEISLEANHLPFTSGINFESNSGIFINNLNNGAACTCSKFANDIKQGGVGEMSDGHADIQKDFHRL